MRRDEDQGERLGPKRREQRRRDREPRVTPVPLPEVRPATYPGAVSKLAEFVRNNISDAGTSKGQIHRPNGGGLGNAANGVRLPPATVMTSGFVWAVTAQLTGATGGTHWEAEVYVNGAATGITYRVAGSTVTVTPGRVDLRPDDIISVYDLRSGVLNAVTAHVDVWGRIEGLAGAAGV